MRRGEKLIITRLESGLYMIEQEDQSARVVGGAASTAVALCHYVFATEAMETPQYITEDNNGLI